LDGRGSDEEETQPVWQELCGRPVGGGGADGVLGAPGDGPGGGDPASAGRAPRQRRRGLAAC